MKLCTWILTTPFIIKFKCSCSFVVYYCDFCVATFADSSDGSSMHIKQSCKNSTLWSQYVNSLVPFLNVDCRTVLTVGKKRSILERGKERARI